MSRFALAAAVALTACTAANPDEWAGDMARPHDPPITFPSTDMATDMARTVDMARDAWVCVPAISVVDGKPCGCPEMPCCMEGELSALRDGWVGMPQCFGITQPPGGHNEKCQQIGASGSNRYMCVVCGHLNEACCNTSDPLCYDGSKCNGARCVNR